MALGRQNSNNDGTKLVLIEDVSKNKSENGKPYFSVKTKGEDGKYAESARVDRFSGTLTKVATGLRFDESTEKGKELVAKYGNSPTVTLTLKDLEAGETYSWKMGFGIATRGLLNRLLTLQSGEGLEISIWQNDKGFDTLTLRQNGELVKWKFEKADLPEVKEFTLRGQKVRDYEEVDAFFVEQLKAFVIGESPAEPSEPEVANEEVGDEIPF